MRRLNYDCRNIIKKGLYQVTMIIITYDVLGKLGHAPLPIVGKLLDHREKTYDFLQQFNDNRGCL